MALCPEGRGREHCFCQERITRTQDPKCCYCRALRSELEPFTQVPFQAPRPVFNWVEEINPYDIFPKSLAKSDPVDDGSDENLFNEQGERNG